MLARHRSRAQGQPMHYMRRQKLPNQPELVFAPAHIFSSDESTRAAAKSMNKCNRINSRPFNSENRSSLFRSAKWPFWTPYGFPADAVTTEGAPAVMVGAVTGLTRCESRRARASAPGAAHGNIITQTAIREQNTSIDRFRFDKGARETHPRQPHAEPLLQASTRPAKQAAKA